MIFWEDSIIARARQVLSVENEQEMTIKSHFFILLRRFHPDMHGSHYREQTQLLIEAYNVLTGKSIPSDSLSLENDDLVISLLPKTVTPVKLGIKYEDWIKAKYYDFVKP